MKSTFADARPDLAKYYKPELNGGKLMSEFSKSVNLKITLCCDVCNTHKIVPISRYGTVNSKVKFVCVYCKSLAVLYPELLKEWHPDNELNPEIIAAKSHTRVKWKCSNCEHEWNTKLQSRTQEKSNCPKCIVKVITINADNCFALNHFKLMKQWHPVKNTLDPYKITSGTHNFAWWICEQGHEWKAKVQNRTQSNAGCPVCSGRILSDKNRLSIVYPKLAKEWDYDENEKIPYDYNIGSKEKVHWKCKYNHKWTAKINNRTSCHSRCPICNSNSKGEEIIHEWLEENQIEHVWQYSVKIEGQIRKFDFYIPEGEIFIEIHGGQHFKFIPMFKMSLEERQKIDKQKRDYAEAHGQYIMIDYREHNPELTLKRFIDQLAELA